MYHLVCLVCYNTLTHTNKCNARVLELNLSIILLIMHFNAAGTNEGINLILVKIILRD